MAMISKNIDEAKMPFFADLEEGSWWMTLPLQHVTDYRRGNTPCPWPKYLERVIGYRSFALVR